MKYVTQPLVPELFTTEKAVGVITYVNSEEFSRYNVLHAGGCVKCDQMSISSYGEGD